MMLLNLTSTQMQQTLREHVLLAAVRGVVLTLALTALVGIAIATAGLGQLKSRADTVKQEAAQSSLLLKAQAQGSIAETTQRVNSQVRSLLDVQKRYVFLTPLIQHIAAITPTAISLRTVGCSVKSGTCTVSGIAATREAYTAYEKTLEESDHFSDVVFPLMTKRTNLDFNVTMKATFTF